MFAYLEQRNADAAFKCEMRAGVHSGPAVGGIIGKQNLSFDLWGDTVNLASRLESAAEAGRINLSAYSYSLVKNTFPCTYRGKIERKTAERWTCTSSIDAGWPQRRRNPLRTNGAGDRTRTCTGLRLEDFKTKRKGRRINVYLIRCPFPFTRVTRSALQSEESGHPGGHLSRREPTRKRPVARTKPRYRLHFRPATDKSYPWDF
jgi:hypothetical protein